MQYKTHCNSLNEILKEYISCLLREASDDPDLVQLLIVLSDYLQERGFEMYLYTYNTSKWRFRKEYSLEGEHYFEIVVFTGLNKDMSETSMKNVHIKLYQDGEEYFGRDNWVVPHPRDQSENSQFFREINDAIKEYEEIIDENS